MKIKVVKAFCLKAARPEGLYLLQIQFIEGSKILPKDRYVGISQNDLSFTVKGLPIGGFKEEDQSFPIEIHEPDFPIETFDGQIFIKK
jgi:hypothetical protein